MIDYSVLSDSDLLQMTNSGDGLAEETLLERYSKLVKGISRTMYLVGGERDDLIQEGMIGLHSAIVHYSSERDAAFSTYAERCVKNRLISAIKSANRLKHNPLNEGLSIEQMLEDDSRQQSLFSYACTNPEDLMLANESKKELRDAFADLLSRFELNVLALYLDGLSYGKIAEILGKPEKSIDNAVQRIRRKLARNLNLGEISYS